MQATPYKPHAHLRVVSAYYVLMLRVVIMISALPYKALCLSKTIPGGQALGSQSSGPKFGPIA